MRLKRKAVGIKHTFDSDAAGSRFAEQAAQLFDMKFQSYRLIL